eukprot:6819722-Alexandrium_andersonii.AAC.1
MVTLQPLVELPITAGWVGPLSKPTEQVMRRGGEVTDASGDRWCGGGGDSASKVGISGPASGGCC